MTRQEVLDQMASGQHLRWVSREVSGKEAVSQWQLGIRDLFLGKQELNEDDCILVMCMEESGDILLEADKKNKKHVVNYSLP